MSDYMHKHSSPVRYKRRTKLFLTSGTTWHHMGRNPTTNTPVGSGCQIDLAEWCNIEALLRPLGTSLGTSLMSPPTLARRMRVFLSSETNSSAISTNIVMSFLTC